MVWTQTEGWQWLNRNLPKRIDNHYKEDGSFFVQRDDHKNNEFVPDFSLKGWDVILTHYDYDFFLKFRPQIIWLLFNNYKISGYEKYLSTDSRFYAFSHLPTAEIPIDSEGKPTMIFFKKIKKRG